MLLMNPPETDSCSRRTSSTATAAPIGGGQARHKRTTIDRFLAASTAGLALLAACRGMPGVNANTAAHQPLLPGTGLQQPNRANFGNQNRSLETDLTAGYNGGTRRLLRSLQASPGSPPRCLDFPTRAHDNQRTGLAACETQLTSNNVNVAQFGKIGSMAVDGPTYAAPLFLDDLAVANGTYDVALICTMHNSVYLFNVDQPDHPLWQVSLGPSVPKSSFPGTSDVGNEIGILSTPTIDRASSTLWVVSATPTRADVHYRLHALDLLTGRAKAAARIISGAAASTTTDAVHGQVRFKGSHQLQRPGLLYQNGLVHIGFGSHADTRPYHGWMFSYDGASLRRTGVVLTTAHSQGGAIWQAGAGLASAGGKEVFFSTGNGFGTRANLPDDRSESLIKVVADGSGSRIVDWFTPANWAYLDKLDLDIGISGPMLIPGTGQAIFGGKTGTLYNIPYERLGHIKAQDAQLTDKIQAASGTYDPIRGSTVLWRGPQGTSIFVTSQFDRLKAFSFDGLHLSHSPSHVSQDSDHGGFATVTSNQAHAHTGIVWTSSQTAGGSLRAYDASTLRLLYTSEQNPGRDHSGAFVKFLPPTPADGRVLLGGLNNRVNIYGLLTATG